MNRIDFKTTTAGLAALMFCTAVSATEKQITLDELFSTDRVLDVQITLAEKDWDRIRRQSRDFVSALHEKRKTAPINGPYEYVDADVNIDGVKFKKVGLRKKGFIGSQSTSRPSLKLKLNHTDKEQNIGGLTNLTMNNNKQDSSIVSQYLGYRLFNAAGSPASRCAFAKVTVNGNNLGIYSHVESMANRYWPGCLAMIKARCTRARWSIFTRDGREALNTNAATTKPAEKKSSS